MSADEWIGYGAICLSVAWLTAALVAKVCITRAIRAEEARKKAPRPPLPQRLPQRVYVAGSCHCADCNALAEQVRTSVAIAIARAEAASIDSEWAEMNGDAS